MQTTARQRMHTARALQSLCDKLATRMTRLRTQRATKGSPGGTGGRGTGGIGV